MKIKTIGRLSVFIVSLKRQNFQLTNFMFWSMDW